MKPIALITPVMRALALLSCAGIALSTAYAQTPAAPAPAAATQQVVRDVQVRGNQRIETDTIRSYVSLRPGDTYTSAAVDQVIKSLFGTGLFSDVKTGFANGVLTVNVVENPIINQVDFEGNRAVSNDDMTKEVQLKARSVYTRAKVQADVQRIIELYRRHGKFGAYVNPQIIQRPQNRVDLIFSIREGASTGISRISFVGNKAFDDDTLRGQITTSESAWYKFLSSNDNYDPDRLGYDREQLRRYYNNHGYADFRVTSSVAGLTTDRSSFFVTFTINEGAKYTFGKISIASNIRDLTPASLRPMVAIQSGQTYAAEAVQNAIDALTNAAGAKGYAFAEIHPRIVPNEKTRTIDLSFQIEQGPRVYIEKINISGNARTLDKVIRREFRLTEGDAFNRVLVDRSRTRIRGLGYFSDVSIKQTPGSQPDRTNLNVAVTEQSTGELSIGAGYSSESSIIGEFSYTQRNLFGRGQYLRGSIQASTINKQVQLSFAEPYFLDRQLLAGVDLYKTVTAYDRAAYEADTTGIGLRLGFPVSEFGNAELRYTYSIDKLSPYTNASIEVLSAAGRASRSVLGFTFSYNTLDDYQKPTKGFVLNLRQDFAGPGGDLQYFLFEPSFIAYRPVLWDFFVGSVSLNAGYVTAYGGQLVPINQRYFKGGDSFPGFAVAGIGPRDLAYSGDFSSIGGNAYAIGSAQLRLPSFLPEAYGISTSLFTYLGTLGHVDSSRLGCNITATAANPVTSCVKDNFALRGSAGIMVGWKSPFGPISIALGMPFAKAAYDKTELLHFSAGTGL